MKILDKLKQEVEQQMHKMGAPSIAKRYAKLTPQIKKELIKKVVHQGQTIRQSSLDLCINYSSAKSIVAEFKRQIINDGSNTFQDGTNSQLNSQDLQITERRATISNDMQGYQWSNFALLTSIGGQINFQMTLNQYLPYLMISKFKQPEDCKKDLKEHEEQSKQQSLDTFQKQQ